MQPNLLHELNNKSSQSNSNNYKSSINNNCQLRYMKYSN